MKELKQKYIEIVDSLSYDNCKQLLVAALIKIELMEDDTKSLEKKLRSCNYDEKCWGFGGTDR